MQAYVTWWRVFGAGLSVALLAGAAWTQQAVSGVSFEEKFALGEGRKAVLDQLIPGSEDFYYYSSLERQHAGDLAAVDALLAAWSNRYNRTERVIEIENRQALLRFETDGGATFNFLRDRLGLQFEHQREVPGEKPDLPTQLDAALVTEDAWAQRALRLHPQTVEGFRAAAWRRLAEGELSDGLLT